MDRNFFLCGADGSDLSGLESAGTLDTCFQVERQGCLVVVVVVFCQLNSWMLGGSLNVQSQTNKTQQEQYYCQQNVLSPITATVAAAATLVVVQTLLVVLSGAICR